ncbi:MAG: tetratricopeptide repeat protein [Gammaproteobacteria bacterium]|nr:tetratricopeptide repeat protein [Gammaproteobacteria bacterium]
MQTYTTEEEQLQILINFLKRHGVKILTVVLIVTISLLGWQYLNKRAEKKIAHASSMYERLLIATTESDQKKLSTDLATNYRKTIYGKIAAVYLANQLVSEQKWQQAAEQYQKIYNETDSWPDLQIVILENWLRTLIELKQFDVALNKLSKVESKLATLYPLNFYNLKGDILSSQDKKSEAVTAYNLALESGKGDSNTVAQMSQFYNWITLKRNDLLEAKQLV